MKTPGTNFFAQLNAEVKISLTNDSGLAVLALCDGNPNVVALDADQFAVGCQMIREDILTGNNIYFNTGTVSVPVWTLNGSGAATSITGLIEAGTNVTITGTGTLADPYIINSSGGSGVIGTPTQVFYADLVTGLPVGDTGFTRDEANNFNTNISTATVTGEASNLSLTPTNAAIQSSDTILGVLANVGTTVGSGQSTTASVYVSDTNLNKSSSWQADFDTVTGFLNLHIINRNLMWTFPAVHSTGTQALVEDGSGNMSWANILGSVSVTAPITGDGTVGNPLAITGTPTQITYYGASGNLTSDADFTRQEAGGNFATSIKATDGITLAQVALNAGNYSVSVTGTGGEFYGNSVDTLSQKGADFLYTSSSNRFGLVLNNPGFSYLSAIQLGNNGAAMLKLINNGFSWLWPTADGSAGQQLTTNASGVLSWADGGLSTVSVTAPITGDGTSGNPLTISGTPYEVSYYNNAGLQSSDTLFTRQNDNNYNTDIGAELALTNSSNLVIHNDSLQFIQSDQIGANTYSSSTTFDSTHANLGYHNLNTNQKYDITATGTEIKMQFTDFTTGLPTNYVQVNGTNVINFSSDNVTNSSVTTDPTSVQVVQSDSAGTYTSLLQAGTNDARIQFQNIGGSGIVSSAKATPTGLEISATDGFFNSGVTATPSTLSFIVNNGVSQFTDVWPNASANGYLINDGTGVMSWQTGVSFLWGQTSGLISQPSGTNMDTEAFFGALAGNGANTSGTTMMGYGAGSNTAANNITAIGTNALQGATNAAGTTALGINAGLNSPNLANGLLLGSGAGSNDTVDTHLGGSVILIGTNSSTGGFKNSVGIGDGVTNTAQKQFLVDQPTNRFTSIILESLGIASIGDELMIGNGTRTVVSDLLQAVIHRTSYNGNDSLTFLSNYKNDGSSGETTIGDIDSSNNGTTWKLDDVAQTISQSSGTANRTVMVGKAITLTDSVATEVFEVALADTEMTGGFFTISVHATDGTDFQVHTDHVTYSAVNKGGVYTTDIQSSNGDDAIATSSGTLTVTWSISTGTDKVIIEATATSSLAGATIQAYINIDNDSPQVVAIP